MTHSNRLEAAQTRVDELNTALIAARAAKTIAVSAHGAAKAADREEAAAARAVAESRVAELTADLSKAKTEVRAAKKAAKEAGSAAAAVDVSEAAERLRNRFVYCAMRDEVWDRQAGDWLQIRALDNLETVNMPVDEKGHRIQPWAILRADPQADRVHNERYMPGVEDEIAAADGVHWLNLWKAPDITPIAGNAQPIIDHIYYLCNNSWELANHILDWLAYAYQNPGMKINHALLIISSVHGVGKDTLGDQIARRLFGGGNVALVQDDAVADGRNHFMRRAQLVVVAEIMSGDRKDVANKLKPLITQPTVEINEKHLRQYYIRNMANFMFFSNHENAAHIEDEDRRYFVVICRQKARDPQYYDALHAYIESAAFAGFAHFLKTRDLTHFNPKANAPWTPDKKAVQQATRGGAEVWLDDAYESQDRPFMGHLINLRDALGVISTTSGAPKMTIQELSRFLKKKGALDLGPQRVGSGNAPVRVWAIRDAEAVSKMPVDALRTLYQKPIMGAPIVGLGATAH